MFAKLVLLVKGCHLGVTPFCYDNLEVNICIT